MIEKVKQILAIPFDDLQNDKRVLLFLRIYSTLYLNGKSPGTCGKCQRDFYIQLQKNGIKMAINYEEIKNRTCEPNWDGLKYIHVTARDWNDKNLTDKDAVYLLEKGYLKESDFKILPIEYLEKAVEKVITSNTPTQKPRSHKRKSKKAKK